MDLPIAFATLEPLNARALWAAPIRYPGASDLAKPLRVDGQTAWLVTKYPAGKRLVLHGR